MSIEVPLSIKYRPKKLSEVIGQPIVIKAFENAFKYNSLHHAYILAGAYGCGKTSVARIVAAMENCEKGPTQEPCGECKNCKEIFTGKSSDVIEIDAASNRGVDDIRQLNKDIYQSSIECRTKYVIIDEAHSLTREGAEAALKMIEEPPDKVRFILATTEPHKLKETIHSRCILWKFNKVSWTEIYNHLISISGKEQIKYEEEALLIAAKSSKGSVRNALQNLQTIVNYVGNEILTATAAKEALGAIDDKLYFSLMDAIVEDNPSKAFYIINYMLQDGKEIGIILNGINTHLSHILKARICQKDLSKFSFTETEAKQYGEQSDKVKGPVLLSMMRILREISFGITYNLDPQAELECFVVEAIQENRRINNKTVAK